MILTWEAKVVGAAQAAADAALDAAEMNWKHKVTPDWGDWISLGLINMIKCKCMANVSDIRLVKGDSLVKKYKRPGYRDTLRFDQCHEVEPSYHRSRIISVLHIWHRCNTECTKSLQCKFCKWRSSRKGVRNRENGHLQMTVYKDKRYTLQPTDLVIVEPNIAWQQGLSEIKFYHMVSRDMCNVFMVR